MTFEDLDAFQQTRRLVNAIYALTRARSVVNDFRLCSQIQAVLQCRARLDGRSPFIALRHFGQFSTVDEGS